MELWKRCQNSLPAPHVDPKLVSPQRLGLPVSMEPTRGHGCSSCCAAVIPGPETLKNPPMGQAMRDQVLRARMNTLKDFQRLWRSIDPQTPRSLPGIPGWPSEKIRPRGKCSMRLDPPPSTTFFYVEGEDFNGSLSHHAELKMADPIASWTHDGIRRT